MVRSHCTNENGPDGAIFIGGGAGGNRTRVRKPSKDSSTYLVGLFGFNLGLSQSTGRPQTIRLF